MKQEHNEIIAALKQIPSLKKEFDKLEKSIAGTDAKKKTLSKEDYQALILNFDEDAGLKGTGLKARILRAGHELSATQPDFNLSYSKDALHRYMKVIGDDAMSQRITKQLELSELMEVKKQFQSINDFLDDVKIKALNTYLKGK